jgi:urease accessory protein
MVSRYAKVTVLPGVCLTEQYEPLLVAQPRARGEVSASFDGASGESRLRDLRQSGSARALFPRTPSRSLQMVLTNTSGGVTGGDRFRYDVGVRAGASVSITTQAAERAYRAQPGQTGRIDTTLRVGSGSRIAWLPQETILFEGCRFARRLRLEVEEGGSALLVEPLVFGRSAMGETLRDGSFDDRIEIRLAGRTVFLDRTRLVGDITASLDRPGVAGGARAAALLVLVGAGAVTSLARVRATLSATEGVSLLRPDLLVARLLADDAFTLRRSLVPLIEMLHEDVIPRPWMI